MNIWLQLAIFILMLWVMYEVWRKIVIRIYELIETYRRLELLKKELEKLLGAKIEIKKGK